MDQAIQEALEAERRGEVPIGAVLVLDGRALARAGNASVARHDPTAHAEILALRAAGAAIGNYRLTGSILYVTVEPCAMCVGAALHARVARLVYGCADPKGGAAGSVFDLTADGRLNHRIEVTAGVEDETSRMLLQRFFRARRLDPGD